jgi:predicted tellurium resistance membrane protein TerC
MKPLLFIIIVTGISIIISHKYVAEKTWLTYYTATMISFLVSGIVLEIWNRRRRKQEEKDDKPK